MLLLNRRGFSSFVACRSCGESMECENCSVTLTYHRRDRRMLCHYLQLGRARSGTMPEMRQRLYPISRAWDRSASRMNCTGRFRRLGLPDWIAIRPAASGITKPSCAGFRDGDYDILVGTQMIAKGHDIPNVTLVGIVNADIGLGLPDFRPAERTFQLLTQAAGRAGRGETPGIVLIQTINPDHYAIRCAAAQDYEAFYAKEIEFRRLMSYPPFAALANVVVRSVREEEALERSVALARLLQPPPEGITSSGAGGGGGGAGEKRVSLSNAAEDGEPETIE